MSPPLLLLLYCCSRTPHPISSRADYMQGMHCTVSFLSPSLARAGNDIYAHSAQHLQVSRAFLLQQAAWLYERELSQIQAQMRRMPTAAGTGLSNSNPGPALSSPATPVIVTGSTPVFPIPATSARPSPMSAFNGRQTNGRPSREEGSGNGLPAAGLCVAEPRVSPSLPVRSSSPRATPVPIGSKRTPPLPSLSCPY